MSDGSHPQPLTRTYTCPDGTPFPVKFENEEQASIGWRWDQMHSPLPITPLSIEFSRDTGIGFTRTTDRLGAPARFEAIRANGYSFSRPVPFEDDPELRAAVYYRGMEKRSGIILQLWNEEYRPEVEALTRSMLAFDQPDRTLHDLVDRLDQVHAARRRLGELHHLVMIPATFGSSRFIDFCVEELGDEGERLAAGELVQGFPNKSLESAIGLWGLSREAKARPAVERALKEQPGIEVLETLPNVGGGPEFLEQLHEFLEEYGWRHQAFTELALPSWRENPAFPLYTLRSYLDAAEDASPMAMHERVVRRREQLTTEVEGRLAGDPRKVAMFRDWQRAAQQRTVVLEDHNFYIDQKALVATRVPCLAIGRRLAEQGTIDSPDDVFYLTGPDLQKAALDSSARLQSLVRERRTERERWMHILPPATIGEGASEMPVQMQRFFGPASEPQQDGVIKGIAASAGVVRGTARLIRTLDEVDRLSPGEILVTYATAPPWTPLFAIAAAVVTDAGGTLSHCAVVAREYGIPAVTGSKVATARIPDGALITVDGGAGTVRIEPASA